MQYILARRGYPPGAIDAVFGPMTDTALRNFQRAYGLSADGLAGPATIRSLPVHTRSTQPSGSTR
jgi:peptidoglycan hydrolase-like protein with peptidoglycan-binding domain